MNILASEKVLERTTCGIGSIEICVDVFLGEFGKRICRFLRTRVYSFQGEKRAGFDGRKVFC